MFRFSSLESERFEWEGGSGVKQLHTDRAVAARCSKTSALAELCRCFTLVKLLHMVDQPL